MAHTAPALVEYLAQLIANAESKNEQIRLSKRCPLQDMQMLRLRVKALLLEKHNKPERNTTLPADYVASKHKYFRRAAVNNGKA
ncbi:MAG: hypothetical protein VX100_07250 [Pseudomonadota bacterium]|nr:hypothetical protein [Pseudomonadota bacterium]